MVENEVTAAKELETQKDKYLCFQLDGAEYALDIRHVMEIIGLQRITTIPDVPPYIRGVINLRGKIIPVLDVRMRFQLEGRDYDDRTCIIVVHINDKSVGLIVDTVNEVLNIPPAQIQEPPKIKKGSQNRFIAGLARVGDSVKIIINMEKFLFEEEMEEINKKEAVLS
ncbi:chemotaxis protein CheW [Calditrichota bacterium LG25]